MYMSQFCFLSAAYQVGVKYKADGGFLMDCIKTIARRRRSCRNFTAEPLSKEQITELIQDAVWVPNGSNNQPWRFVVITDKEKLKKYSDIAKRMWLENLDQAPHMQPYANTFRDPNSNIFYNAPSLIVIYGNSDFYWYVHDCSMVALNLMLLAEEMGLGSCWIGEAHNVFADSAVKKELEIPEKYQLVAPLILGHPAEKRTFQRNPNPRKPFEIKYL
jgi:nitroreductase